MFFNTKSGATLLCTVCLFLVGCATTSPQVNTGTSVQIAVPAISKLSLEPAKKHVWRPAIGDPDDAEGEEIDEIGYKLYVAAAPVTTVVVRDTTSSSTSNIREGDVDAEVGVLIQ